MTQVANAVVAAAIQNANLAYYPEKDIDFDEDAPATTELTRQHPIMWLDCRLTGNLVVATATATQDGAGGLELIRSLDVVIDGQDIPIHLEGYMLKYLGHFHDRSAPYNDDPALTAGTNAFEYHFRIPLDVGRYATPLDASQRHSLVLKVQWGAPEDGFTAGGGGTIDVSSVKLEVVTVAIAGKPIVNPPIPGAIGYPYPRHILNYREVPISAATTEKAEDLQKDHVYQRLVFFTFSDGALVDTILNKVTLQIGNVNPIAIDADHLQAANVGRYNLGTSKLTGVYCLDLANGPMALDQMISIGGTQRFRVLMDVAHPGTTDVVKILEERYIRPIRRAA